MRLVFTGHKSQSGQSVVEYLVIVALVGVGSIALFKALGQNINVKYSQIISELGGKVQGNKTADAVEESMYRKKDMSDFMKDTSSKK